MAAKRTDASIQSRVFQLHSKMHKMCQILYPLEEYALQTCTSKLLVEASITMSEYEYVEKFHFQDSLLICNFTLSQSIYYIAELLLTVIPT